MKEKSKLNIFTYIIKHPIIFVAVLIIIFIIIPISFYIENPWGIGFIPRNEAGNVLGYYGAIIGGALTLIGVWWTINEQKKDLINEQQRIENQRREDLAIQYRPFLFSNNYDGKNRNVNSNLPPKLYHAFHIFRIGEKEVNKKFYLDVEIKNYGDGECYLNCFEEPLILSNPNKAFIRELVLDDLQQNSMIHKDFTNIIPRKDVFNIHIEIHYNNSEELNIDYLQIIYHFTYNDQFYIKKYDAPVWITLNVLNEHGKIELLPNGISIDNNPLKEDMDIPLIKEEIELQNKINSELDNIKNLIPATITIDNEKSL